MNKEKLLKAFKVTIIICLVLAISLVVLLRWKSDVIMHKVLDSVQGQLTDSLRYEDTRMDWLSYFPCTAIQITGLTIGSGDAPLIKGGNLDIVLSIWPLLRGDILISKLEVSNSVIHLMQKDGHWSYDILRKSEGEEDGSYKTRIRNLVIEESSIRYDDGKNMSFTLDIDQSSFEGSYENNVFETTMDVQSTLSALKLDQHTLSAPLASKLKGQYVFDLNTDVQTFSDWTLEHEAGLLSAQGKITRLKDHEEVDMNLSWSDTDLEKLKPWLPDDWAKQWAPYVFSGNWNGQARIEGKSSATHTPHISLTTNLKNGGVRFSENGEEIKGLSMDISYDSGMDKTPSSLTAQIQKNALFGKSLNGSLRIQNLDRPVVDLSLNGTIPSRLLNLLPSSGIQFEKGDLAFSTFELSGFQTARATLASFVDKANVALTTDHVVFRYGKESFTIDNGSISLSGSTLNLKMDHLKWNLATFTDLEGSIASSTNQLDYQFNSSLCEGKIDTKGKVTDLDQNAVVTGTWIVSGIEMKLLLESFSNFDQTFITAQNLSGKTNIWASSTLPFDAQWNLLTRQVRVQAAIDIHNGRLIDMKTLEDFSNYIHLEDLRDIRFNEIRNYMKIENGIVYLPVMFIQSSALNLSISGQHSFDQDILYHVKLNAGQVASGKLKKNDVRKDFKPARKSGWINMYFILNGTVEDVHYQQNRNGVIAGFEESTALKEKLRNDLVDTFGYDVYWIEPNEWEDIPEYQ